jgi:Tol biopolymer transport system component
VTISRGGRTVLTVRQEADISAPTPPTAAAVVPPTPLQPIVPADPGEEVHRLAEILRRHPPTSLNPSQGTKIFMRDLAGAGQTMLIADTSAMGLPFAEQPDWSHDGRRIVFRAKPTAEGPSTMIILEGRDGRPHLRDVGAGDSPRFSPDDRTIAFVLYPGYPSDEPEGVWLMNADGTNRRRLCELAAPFWSPDGTRILLNGLLSHTISKIYEFATKQTTRINVQGQSIFSWPRWVAPGQIVACIGAGVVPDSIAILDVSRPEEAKVVRKLWNRGAESDVFARWPVLTSPSGDLYFIGEERDTRTLYALAQHLPGRGRFSALEVGGPKLSGPSLSPDHRYLLFASDWLGRDPPREAAESIR